jgi:hypothetical protein
VQTLRPAGLPSGWQTLSAGLLDGSGGAPVEPTVRGFMEPRFGADFSGVQVHADSRAAELSRSISARAFTHGRHIYFGDGEYRPDTQEGKRVLAHELTHVIQQGAGGSPTPAVQRMGARGVQLRANVTPWPPGGPIGSDYQVTTDAGSVVPAWGAYSPVQYHLSYWCHGHTLGTFYDHGYSVYSRAPFRTVIADEWVSVPPAETRAGDIVVWTALYDHSARIVEPVIENGALRPDTTMVSTKNGQAPARTMTLQAVMDMPAYGSIGVAVFRHR